MSTFVQKVGKIAGGIVLTVGVLMLLFMVLHPVVGICVLAYLIYHWPAIQKWADKP